MDPGAIQRVRIPEDFIDGVVKDNLGSAADFEVFNWSVVDDLVTHGVNLVLNVLALEMSDEVTCQLLDHAHNLTNVLRLRPLLSRVAEVLVLAELA